MGGVKTNLWKNLEKIIYKRRRNKMKIAKEMTISEINEALGYDVKIVKEHSKTQLANIEPYKTFKIGETEFIVLEQSYGKTFCLTKDFINENIQFDDNTNNLANASILNILDEFEDKITSQIGYDSLLYFNTDLTSDDGLKDYGCIRRKMSLLTAEQYRQHSLGIEQYPVNNWWWLATPLSTPHRNDNLCVRFVSTDGYLSCYNCYDGFGVRAVCLFDSNIFVSE